MGLLDTGLGSYIKGIVPSFHRTAWLSPGAANEDVRWEHPFKIYHADKKEDDGVDTKVSGVHFLSEPRTASSFPLSHLSVPAHKYSGTLRRRLHKLFSVYLIP